MKVRGQGDALAAPRGSESPHCTPGALRALIALHAHTPVQQEASTQAHELSSLHFHQERDSHKTGSDILLKSRVGSFMDQADVGILVHYGVKQIRVIEHI